jgi:DNA-directed RNA polymerase alpha subunit
MSYRPRLKKQTPYSLTEYKNSKDYFGNVGDFTIVCGSMDGYSVANSLRRNILTKSVGYAVVSYKIEGSESPFDTIHGFDLTTNAVVDNLSKIQFSLVGGGDYDVASISLDKFTGEVTAGMFASDNIKVHNPDLVIAYVSNAPVKIECGVGIGYGYISEEEQKQYFDTIDGWFEKEANFNPATKVSYTCHQYGDEDIVNMKIHCQFNADPFEIFTSSARDLSYIYGIPIQENLRDDVSQNADEICNAFLGISIDNCHELSVRARNALKQGGIPDLRWLLSFSPTSLSSKISGIGDKSIQSIGAFLSNYMTDELIAILKKCCDEKMILNINSYIAKANESIERDDEYDDDYDDENFENKRKTSDEEDY